MGATALAHSPLQLPPETGYDRPVPIGWKYLAAYRVKSPGLSLPDIAKSIGYSYNTVLFWVRRMDYQRYENWVFNQNAPLVPLALEAEQRSVLDKVRTTYETHAEEMQGRLLTILETVDDPKIIKEIAQDWLDRAGAGAPNRTATRALAVVVSDEVMQRFFTRAQEAGLLPAVQDPGSREVINGSLEGVFVEVAAAVDPAEQGT